MSINEQKQVKDKYYNEAIRYMNNAQDTLKKAGKDGNYYKDEKYIKTACGIAYNGVLKALDGYFILKNVSTIKKNRRKSRQYYEISLTTLDKKMLNAFATAYNVLHLDGYYDGVKHVKTITSGFDVAYEIIEKIKP